MINELEEWKYIEGYNNRYLISNYGHIKSLIGKEKELKPYYNSNGYLLIKLSLPPTDKGKYRTKTCFIHRLVAEAFCENYKSDYQVHHIDLNKTNNNYNNLQVLSKKDHAELHKKLRAERQDKAINSCLF